MRIGLVAAACLVSALLTGCLSPPQKPIELSDGYFDARNDRIGVAMTELPKPDTAFPGADCLLCVAVASGVNGTLTSAVQSWTTDDLVPLRKELVALLVGRGQQVVGIDTPIKLGALPDRSDAEQGFARKDFSSLRKSSGVERLLVVNIQSLGAWRNYSAYVPVAAPRAILRAEAFIVDLATHRYDWFQRVEVDRPADGAWDEPPKYPGLTNAYFQVLELTKDSIKRPFAK